MKKMTLKRLFGVLALVGCVVSLASCNDDEEIDYSHTIVYYHTQGDKLTPVTDAAIAAFQAANPGWTVKHTQVGGYDDVKSKCIADLQAKTQPDVAYCYPDHVADYLSTGKVVDLKGMVSDTLKDDIFENYYNEGLASNFGDYAKYGYAEDSLLTLPYVRSTEAMYTNLTVLADCGLTPATTWEEMWQQAPVIKAKYPNMVILGYDSESNWFITMCEQMGWDYTQAATPHYLFNGEDKTACGAWLDTLKSYNASKYLTTQTVYGAYTSGLFTKTDNTGCVYCIGSTGGASYQYSAKFNCTACEIPHPANGEKAVISQGPSFVFFKTNRSDNQEEKLAMTYKFVSEYLMTAKYQALFAKVSGYCPVLESAFDATVTVDDEQITFEEYLADVSVGTAVTSSAQMTALATKLCQQTANYQFTSPAFKGSSTARTQVGNVVVNALTSQETGVDLLETAYINCGGR